MWLIAAARTPIDKSPWPTNGGTGSGFARALNATLARRTGATRTGATRGCVTTYLVPATAIILGATIRHDTIRPFEILGTATILAGAWLTTWRPH